MADRRRAGAVILVAGLALAGVGALGLALGGDDAGSTASRPTTSASPAGSVAPTPSPAPTAPSTAPPTPATSPSPNAEALVAALFADLVEVIRAGSVSSMADRLDPAVIDRYGEVACDQELATRAPDPGYAIAISGIRAPAPWDYVTDGLATTIEETLTVDAQVTSAGTTTARELHVTMVDGEVRWFTDCGTPLGASPSP